MNKFRVGILGATGMVGQRFATILANHPWFEVTTVAASQRSAGTTYANAVAGRWAMKTPVPEAIGQLIVLDAANVEQVSANVDFVFCAVDMKKDEIRALEEAYAKAETPLVSNNSAHRATPDVPMMIPELNWDHARVIDVQRKRLGTKRGFVAVKPNCSLQSYVPALYSLREFGVERAVVSTYQAISGAGKTFETWPEILDNVVPYIGGEEEKSEIEPLKIWGEVTPEGIKPAAKPVFTAQCIRVPVTDGHLATVFVDFARKPSKEEILAAWANFAGEPQKRNLPSAPQPFLRYFEEDNRPQTGLDRDWQNGMGISMGRLREDHLFQYKFVCLSHNTLRGAAGGAVLTAESLVEMGYIQHK